jgi:uncharacterized protein (TIGR03067 family)
MNANWLLGLLGFASFTAMTLLAAEPPVDPAETKHAVSNDKAAESLQKLQGKWNITSILKSGVELDELVKIGISFTFSETRLQITGLGDQTINKVISLQADTTPKLLDFADSIEALKAHTDVWEGIYELEQDTLKWAILLEGDVPAKANRAGAVESKAGSNVVLVTMQRAKE